MRFRTGAHNLAIETGRWARPKTAKAASCMSLPREGGIGGGGGWISPLLCVVLPRGDEQGKSNQTTLICHYSGMNDNGRIFDTFSSGPRGDIAETVTSDGPGSASISLPMEPRLAPSGRPL